MGLADFLFCVSAFGSFAKVSASRRVRAFANVPNQGWTKNMTKPYVRWGIPLPPQVFPSVSTMLPPLSDNHLPVSDMFPFMSKAYRITSNICPLMSTIFSPMPDILPSISD